MPRRESLFPASRALLRASRAVLRFVFSRRILPFIGVLAVLAAIVWQMENWRGHQRWDQVVTAAEAQGDSLEFRTFLPAAVDDHENAATHPYFDVTVVPNQPVPGWGSFPHARNFTSLHDKFSKFLHWDLTQPEGLDLNVWQREFREDKSISWPGPGSVWGTAADDVLLATQDFEDDFAQIAEAFARPHCHWFPFHAAETEQGIAIAQSSNIVSFCESLYCMAHVRALAHLNNSNQESALREVQAALRFSRSSDDQTSIIGILNTMGMAANVNMRLPNLLRHPNWRESDLEQLQACLSESRNLLEFFDVSIRSERAAMVHSSMAAASGEQWPYESGFQDGWIRQVATWMPRGWHYQNMAAGVEWWNQAFLDNFDPSSMRFSAPERLSHGAKFKERINPYNFLIATFIPSISNIYKKSAKVQGQWDLCRVQCALERHRRAAGVYPNDLEDLIPDYLEELPRDYVTGGLPHYALDQDDSFTLGTLDWNRTGNTEQMLSSIPLAAHE